MTGLTRGVLLKCKSDDVYISAPQWRCVAFAEMFTEDSLRARPAAEKQAMTSEDQPRVLAAHQHDRLAPPSIPSRSVLGHASCFASRALVRVFDRLIAETVNRYVKEIRSRYDMSTAARNCL